MKKKVALVAIIMVILLLNLDYLVIIDNYFKAAILFVIAGLLTIFEYKRSQDNDEKKNRQNNFG